MPDLSSEKFDFTPKEGLLKIISIKHGSVLATTIIKVLHKAYNGKIKNTCIDWICLNNQQLHTYYYDNTV